MASKPASRYPANRKSLSGDPRCTTWLQEATIYNKKAKIALNEAKNLKTELKVQNFDMLDRLVSLVAAMEKHYDQVGGEDKTSKSCTQIDSMLDSLNKNNTLIKSIDESLKLRIKELEDRLTDKLDEGIESIKTTTASTKEDQTIEICDWINHTLNKNISKTEDFVDGSFDSFIDRFEAKTDQITKKLEDGFGNLASNIAPTHGGEELTGEIGKLRAAVEDLRTRGPAPGDTPSYADAVRQPRSPWEHKPTHSLIISSKEGLDTSGGVIEHIKGALDARKSGIRVERLRKTREGKVILSCSTRTELDKVEERLKTRANITYEQARNKNPLVIFKNVLSYNTDDEIKAALFNQNSSALGDLAADISQAEVLYRRRARNQQECHLVLRVTPALYQKLMLAGRVYIDLQRVRVEDQSPLVQCTKCLAYGHGRKTCTEAVDLCHYCGGPHLKAKCDQFLAALAPTCKSCVRAKLPDTSHSVYDDQCPVRKKWDALARSAVAYS